MANKFDLANLSPAPWFVVYSETTEELSNGIGSLEIGPHEDDCADTFMFSENFGASDGVPEEVEAAFLFIALARNAFDVIMRRKWSVHQDDFGTTWRLATTGLDMEDYDNAVRVWKWSGAQKHTDPFTALVEADRWYRENVEANRGIL